MKKHLFTHLGSLALAICLGFTFINTNSFNHTSATYDSTKINARMIAHKGHVYDTDWDTRVCTDNTFESYLNASKRNYYGIETDIYKTSDGRYITFHNDSVDFSNPLNTDKTTGDWRYLSKSTYSDLKALNISQIAGKTACMCDFEDYLRICKDSGKNAVIELKMTFSKEDIHEILDIVHNFGMSDDCTIISFYVFGDGSNIADTLEYAKLTNRGYKTHLLTNNSATDDWVNWCIEKGSAISMQYGSTICNQSNVNKMHNAGLEAACWTLNSKSQIDTAVNMGMDYITSDRYECSNPYLNNTVFSSKPNPLNYNINFEKTTNGYAIHKLNKINDVATYKQKIHLDGTSFVLRGEHLPRQHASGFHFSKTPDQIMSDASSPNFFMIPGLYSTSQSRFIVASKEKYDSSANFLAYSNKNLTNHSLFNGGNPYDGAVLTSTISNDFYSYAIKFSFNRVTDLGSDGITNGYKVTLSNVPNYNPMITSSYPYSGNYNTSDDYTSLYFYLKDSDLTGVDSEGNTYLCFSGMALNSEDAAVDTKLNLENFSTDTIHSNGMFKINNTVNGTKASVIENDVYGIFNLRNSKDVVSYNEKLLVDNLSFDLNIPNMSKGDDFFLALNDNDSSYGIDEDTSLAKLVITRPSFSSVKEDSDGRKIVQYRIFFIGGNYYNDINNDSSGTGSYVTYNYSDEDLTKNQIWNGGTGASNRRLNQMLFYYAIYDEKFETTSLGINISFSYITSKEAYKIKITPLDPDTSGYIPKTVGGAGEAINFDDNDGSTYFYSPKSNLVKSDDGKAYITLSTSNLKSSDAYLSNINATASHTLSFETNGGSLIAPVTYLPDQVTIKPSDPIRDGYKFALWYSDVTLTTPFVFGNVLTANTTIYAKWDEITVFTIYFVMNGYGQQIDPILVNKGKLIPEPAEPKDDNATFAGWFKDSDLTIEWDFKKDTVSSNITLYARWLTGLDAIKYKALKEVETINNSLNELIITYDVDIFNISNLYEMTSAKIILADDEDTVNLLLKQYRAAATIIALRNK